jgi:hypothetical protein
MSLTEPHSNAAHRAATPGTTLATRTLAEARRHLTHPGTVAILALASLACGISGPFATDTILGLGPRIVFRTAMVFVTYALGTLASDFVWDAWAHAMRPWPAYVMAALGPGLAAPPVILGLNTVMLGTPDPFDGLWAFVVSLVLVCGAVGVLGHLATRGIPAAWFGKAADLARMPAPAQGGDGAPARSDPAAPLLNRLPEQVRAPLVALSGEDHDTLVRTLAGEVRLLMRLSDAIALADEVPGLRVHRSHWVARDQVRAVRSDGGRVVLAMTQGAEIPVSRSNQDELRRTGLTEQ